MNQPLVSIIIPCRNEADFISRCLDSLLAQDYPKNKIEVLAIDGASTDGTRKIIESYTQKDGRIKLLDNPQKFTPVSLNIGIQNAKGDLITKTDAHTIYPPDYISKCVRYLDEYKTDAVGGVTYNVPAADSLSAKAITLVLGSPLGSGGA
ncbi:MAG: glycosyltransferase, partial [Candidatus Colwellbacteria bacterium]